VANGLQAKLANFHSLLESRNLHFNDSLSSSKAFRNPRIYNKLVEFLAVQDETGNCWDKSIWDGSKIGRDGDAKRIGSPLSLFSVFGSNRGAENAGRQQLNCRNFDQSRNKLDNYPLNHHEVQSISLPPEHPHHRQRRHRLEGSRVDIGREMIGMQARVGERRGADGIMGTER